MSKLLVIDDEPNITFTIAETLGSEELTVLTASTAREGIELFRRQQPDVVLCDVRLPDQSGLDAFKCILKETMRHFDFNQFQAAECLGVSRMTLRNKLRALGLRVGKSNGNAGDRS
jgi:DNA-binding NtrC family response regulator